MVPPGYQRAGVIEVYVTHVKVVPHGAVEVALYSVMFVIPKMHVLKS